MLSYFWFLHGLMNVAESSSKQPGICPAHHMASQTREIFNQDSRQMFMALNMATIARLLWFRSSSRICLIPSLSLTYISMNCLQHPLLRHFHRSVTPLHIGEGGRKPNTFSYSESIILGGKRSQFDNISIKSIRILHTLGCNNSI